MTGIESARLEFSDDRGTRNRWIHGQAIVHDRGKHPEEREERERAMQ
ncbi:MAG: hypothetical protein OEX97_07135 [Acidimicrobiia bacterium]|nr:hypothetical protein [Acidimicrobiia bacterium]